MTSSYYRLHRRVPFVASILTLTDVTSALAVLTKSCEKGRNGCLKRYIRLHCVDKVKTLTDLERARDFTLVATLLTLFAATGRDLNPPVLKSTYLSFYSPWSSRPSDAGALFRAFPAESPRQPTQRRSGKGMEAKTLGKD